mmetsp:Transcript_4362/g.5780  ORF Transcript_4362/g.5780 Transcript_4362/m.5780 type:complete len:955 (+) Transcript_4362:52-2916(+)
MAQRRQQQQVEDRVRLLFAGQDGWIHQLEEQKVTEIGALGGFSLGSRPKLVKRFAKALGKNESLKKLCLDNCDLRDAGVSYIAKALLRNDTLDCLSLCNNSIKVKGASHLAKLLKDNKTLRNVSLNSNNLRDSEIEYFAAGLRVNDTLRILYLNHNHIGDTGTADLADSLAFNHGLVELHLRGNNIGKIGAQYISDALKANKNLGMLDLGGNNIGDTGAESLATALLFNQSLWKLNIDWNNLSDKGIVGFSTALESNKTLTDLRTWGNDFNEFGDPGMYQHVIERLLKRNKETKEKQFREALNSEESATWNRSRLMFVGQGKAGKTATVRSLLGQPFVADWDSTIGADISEVKSTREKGEWRKDSLNSESDPVSSYFAARIMLGMGKPKLHVLREQIGSEEKKYVQKTNKTKTTYEKQDKKYVREARLDKNTGSSSRNKVAKDSNTMMNSPGGRKNEVVQEYDENLLLNARNDADALILSLWDFGGQKVFYAMHHLFLTKHGVYLLVFDMREILNLRTRNAAMKYMSFWLSSIRLHAPLSPILLVGTFLDRIDSEGDLREINNILREKMKSSAAQIINCDSEDLVFFPVDNEKGFGIIELRLKIEEVARNGSLFNEQVSMRFINFLDELLSAKYRENEQKPFLTLPVVKKMASKVGINNSATLLMALEFFHECGMLIHLTATQALTNMIILKPQWLIDALSKVIRDVDNVQHVHDIDEFANVGLKADLDMVSENALASRDFLEYVWDKGEVDFLLDYLKITMFLSEWNVHKGDESWFLIPCLLRNTYEKKIDGLKCIFDFSKGFLSSEIFHRLTCLIVSYCSEYRSKYGDVAECLVDFNPELYRNFASIACVPGFQFQLLYDSDLNRIIAFIENKTFAARTLHVIQAMLLKAKSDTVIMGAGTGWEILLENDITSDLIGYSDARKQLLLPWFDDVNRAFGSGNGSLNVDLNTLF